MAKEKQSKSERGSVEILKEKSAQDHFGGRTLENTCPFLNDFLKPDMKVLDIGCSPGTITIGVARQANRGSVVGMDPNEEALKNARAAADEAKLENVEFRAGDTYSLEFPDKTFDLVYSQALFDWLREPVKALKEQARVTRPGGWVIAMIRSLEFIGLFPEYPELKRIHAAYRALKDGPKDIPFFNTLAAHEAVKFLVAARFQNYKILSFMPNLEVAYPGSEYFDYHYQHLKLSAFWSEKVHEYILSKGLIEEDTLEKAKAEIEAWYHHPHALSIQPVVAACGQVD